MCGFIDRFFESASQDEVRVFVALVRYARERPMIAHTVKTVIASASEAIQNARLLTDGLLRRFAPRNDGSNYKSTTT